MEVGGYLVVIIGLPLGAVSAAGLLAFTLVAIGLGVVLSLTSLLLEQAAFNTYPRPRDILVLLATALGENLGYRQLMAVWRIQGLWRWFRKADASWGVMARSASWAVSRPTPPADSSSPDSAPVPQRKAS
jgi:hypothetical protein